MVVSTSKELILSCWNVFNRYYQLISIIWKIKWKSSTDPKYVKFLGFNSSSKCVLCVLRVNQILFTLYTDDILFSIWLIPVRGGDSSFILNKVKNVTRRNRIKIFCLFVAFHTVCLLWPSRITRLLDSSIQILQVQICKERFVPFFFRNKLFFLYFLWYNIQMQFLIRVEFLSRFYCFLCHRRTIHDWRDGRAVACSAYWIVHKSCGYHGKNGINTVYASSANDVHSNGVLIWWINSDNDGGDDEGFLEDCFRWSDFFHLC